MRADVIHEHAVMRHKDHGSPEFQQEFFQPFHGVKVEVVGGFVQQQHVRSGGEHPGQLGPFAPAAGKLRQRLRPFRSVEAEAGKHGLRLLLRVVSVAGFQIVLTGHEPGQRGFVSGCVGLFPLRPEVAPVRQGALHPRQQGSIQGIVVKNLFHIAHPAFTGHDDPARIGLGRARHDPDERGLAAAVRTADAEPHAVQHVKGEVGQNVLAAVRFADILKSNVHGVYCGAELLSVY